METKYEKAIKAIAEIMGVQFSAQPETQIQPEVISEVKLTEAKLADETVINFEGELAIGTVIELPNGDYALEDGSGFTIEDNTVTALIPVPAAEEAAPVEEKTDEKYNALEERLNKIESLLTEMNQANTKLSAIVKTISEMSATESVTRTESIAQSTNEKSNLERLGGKEGKRLEGIFKAISKK